ncbi:dextranase isoform X2 [Plectropomus leopardus]|uniref:dextranase isoform X2 n=1 Tax=Plectropomus leopardus TaxID=160734 RepID=UPI001C4D31EE|nr:dextranase isoform X2 [Plectropomus leopardus]
MSKDVNRYKVFQTTRVRHALKNDGCWIHKSKEENEEQEKASTDQEVETKLSPVRQKSYVLSTARKFESLDSPVSPPFQKMQFTPSDGSSNQGNCEAIPPCKDAQPEGSTAETTDDAKPQAPKEKLITNGETQPEQSVANTTAENKGDAAVASQSNVEHTDGAAEVSAEIHVAEPIQNDEAHPVSSTSPEAVSPVEPVANSTPVEDLVAEPSAAVITEDGKDTVEAPVAPAVELQLQEEPSTVAVPAYKTHLEDTEVESVQPEKGIGEECHPEQAAEKIVETVTEVVVKSTSDTSDVVNAMPEKGAASQNSVEAVAEVVVKSLPDTSDTVSATPVTEAAVPQVSHEAEVAVVSKTPDVTGLQEEAALQVSVEPVPDLVVPSVSEPLAQPVTESATEESCVKGPPEQATEETVEVVADVAVVPEPPVVNGSAGEEAISVEPVPDLVVESVSETSAQPVAETTEGSCEKGPPGPVNGETVKDVVDVVVEPSPEMPAVTGAAQQEAAPQVSVEPIPDLVAGTVSESLETAVKSEECKAEPAAQAEPVLKTTAKEVVECEIQPVDNTVVEQSVESVPESAADHVAELKIEDAVKPVTAPNAEAVLEKFSDRPIELWEALDVKPPTTEANPEPVKDPKQFQAEEIKPNHHSDETISDIFQKPKKKQTYPQIRIRNTSICSICDQTFVGNVKLHLSDPVITCHPECLKCGVCAKPLGDLLIPMYLHEQDVQCRDCFAITLKKTQA